MVRSPLTPSPLLLKLLVLSRLVIMVSVNLCCLSASFYLFLGRGLKPFKLSLSMVCGSNFFRWIWDPPPSSVWSCFIFKVRLLQSAVVILVAFVRDVDSRLGVSDMSPSLHVDGLVRFKQLLPWMVGVLFLRFSDLFRFVEISRFQEFRFASNALIASISVLVFDFILFVLERVFWTTFVVFGLVVHPFGLIMWFDWVRYMPQVSCIFFYFNLNLFRILQRRRKKSSQCMIIKNLQCGTATLSAITPKNVNGNVWRTKNHQIILRELR